MYKATLVLMIFLISLTDSARALVDEAVAAAHRGEYTAALQLMSPLTEKGDARAQFNMGYMYANGWGLQRDPAEAAEWYRKAADQGLPIAQHYLGMGYAFGEGVPADDIEAARWFRRAADQGYPISQFALGFAYANGLGVPNDLVSAYMWLLLSGQRTVRSSAPFVRRGIERQMTSVQLTQAEKAATDWKPKPEVGQISTSQARPEELLGFDRHGEFADPSIWPVSAVGTITVANYLQAGYCTGTVIGPKLVLTAAHCLFFRKQLFKPGNVHFLAGMNRGMSAAISVAEQLIVSKDFSPENPEKPMSPETSSSDWALIVLKNPVSIRPVPIKAIPREQLDTISKSGTIMQVGYGVERPYSPSIARKCRILKSPEDRIFSFRCLANFGYSGSPILAEINGTPTIIGIASAGIWELLLGTACPASQFEKPVTELIGPASNGG